MISEKEKWAEYNQLIIESIDIEATCKEWGLEFTGGVTGKGWMECRAMDRADNKPSCSVNRVSGYYNDKGPGPSYPFFTLGVHYGPYSHYTECRDDLAKKAKVLSKRPKSKRGDSFRSKLRYQKWLPAVSAGLCRKVKVSDETLRMVGGVQAGTNRSQSVVSFPIYDASLGFDAPGKGCVIQESNGGKIEHYRGNAAQPQMLTSMSLGEAGIMNKHALTHWKKATIIYKVEGISDMLRLQEEIPEEFKNTHLVVTNSDGCDADRTPHAFADMCKDKNICIIHDADEPGQFGGSASKNGGAIRWTNCLLRTARNVRNLQLPYEIAPKKGKDLRDWFDEGNTYADLMKLVKETEFCVKSAIETEMYTESGLTDHQITLRALDLIVLGHSKDGQIEVFNAAECAKFTVKDIDKFSYNKMLIYINDAASEKIANPNKPDKEQEDMIDPNDVRTAISTEAGGKELSRTNTVGVGLWESGGRIFAVGSGEWVAVNGGVQSYTAPMVDDKIVDFGNHADEWYDKDLLYEYLDSAQSPEWRTEHMNELAEILGRWDNHTHPLASQIVACLAMASWGQAIWEWRPWIAITGESSSGKTALMDFLADYFGKMAFATTNTTEPAVRNTIGRSSRVFMHDEFEDSPHRTAILDMLMASNRAGAFGKSYRSNAAQGSVEASYELMPWFSGVEMKMDKQTEVNRYIIFELGSRKGMEYFHIPDDPDEINRLRNASIAVIMRCWKRIKELAEIITKSLGGEYTRQSESYALASATYGAITAQTDEEAIRSHKSLMKELMKHTVEEEESEQEQVLSAISSSLVMLAGGHRKSVGELLQAEDDRLSPSPESELARIGVKRFPYSEMSASKEWVEAMEAGEAVEGAYVFFSTSKTSYVVRGLLKGTQYERQNIKALLKRLPGAFIGRVRVNGDNPRGVFVPADLMGAADYQGDFAAPDVMPQQAPKVGNEYDNV